MAIQPVNNQTQGNYNTRQSSNQSGLIEFDPTTANLQAVENINTIPRSVLDMLNATGFYSLNPIEGWTKTVLQKDNLATLFGSNIIYTPPASELSTYNVLSQVQAQNDIFTNLISTLFDEPAQQTDGTNQTDSYQASPQDNGSLIAMLQSKVNHQ